MQLPANYGAVKADAGLPPTIVVPTVPIAIIGPAVSIAIIRSVVMSAVAIAIIRSVVMSIAVPIPPVIIDFLHSTVALGKRQNAGLRGSGSGCVDHQDDDK